MTKQRLVYQGITYAGYLYDPETNTVYGPRGPLKEQKNNGVLVSASGMKPKWISLKKLHASYAGVSKTNEIDVTVVEFISANCILAMNDRVQFSLLYSQYIEFCEQRNIKSLSEKELISSLKKGYRVLSRKEAGAQLVYGLKFKAIKNNSSENNFVEEKNEEVEETKQVTNKRAEGLKEINLNSSFVWNTDTSTLVKAHTLLDNLDAYEFDLLEREVYNVMYKHGLDEKAIPSLMVQVASTRVLAEELAKQTKYRKEFNNLQLEEVKKEICPMFDEVLETYIIKEWKEQIRERFFNYTLYMRDGIRLRGYADLVIPLQTLEQIQSAFKLLTDLFGWEAK